MRHRYRYPKRFSQLKKNLAFQTSVNGESRVAEITAHLQRRSITPQADVHMIRRRFKANMPKSPQTSLSELRPKNRQAIPPLGSGSSPVQLRTSLRLMPSCRSGARLCLVRAHLYSIRMNANLVETTDKRSHLKFITTLALASLRHANA